MFENLSDQARGLASWDLALPTRVLPVVAGDSPETLRYSHELLWTLEQGLKAQGQTVVVLEDMSGLSPRDAAAGHQAVLRRWLSGIAPGCVVLLHAPLEAMAVLLTDSHARPLVALHDERRSLIWAYNAAKVLVQAAGLEPVLLMPGAGPAERHRQVAQAIASTCEQRLGAVPSVWVLGYDDQCSGTQRRESDACLLRVLDCALMIDEKRAREHVDQRFEYRQPTADPIIGASDVHRQRHA